MPRFSRSCLWLLLAAALFMRAFLPQGYMPERTGSGTIAIVVCGSDALHFVELGNQPDGENERQRAEPPCAFAGLGAAPVPSAAFPQLLRPVAGAAAYAEHPAAPVLPIATRLHPPARAPPLTA